MDIGAAQRAAAEIARKYGPFECDRCAKEIAKKLGSGADAAFERLCTSDHSDIIGLARVDVQVSANRVHVGVRIGDLIFDNHHPEGVQASEWARRFITATSALLVLESKNVREFFGKVFLLKRFNGWLYGR